MLVEKAQNAAVVEPDAHNPLLDRLLVKIAHLAPSKTPTAPPVVKTVLLANIRVKSLGYSTVWSALGVAIKTLPDERSVNCARSDFIPMWKVPDHFLVFFKIICVVNICPGRENCSGCEVGKYAAAEGSAFCLVCEAGRTQAEIGQIACTDCAFGKYKGTTDITSCDDCEPGKYTGTATTLLSCTSCPKGQYQSTGGQTRCNNCPVGTYQDTEAAETCLNCSAGYVFFSIFFSVCISCLSPCISLSLCLSVSLSYICLMSLFLFLSNSTLNVVYVDCIVTSEEVQLACSARAGNIKVVQDKMTASLVPVVRSLPLMDKLHVSTALWEPMPPEKKLHSV